MCSNADTRDSRNQNIALQGPTPKIMNILFTRGGKNLQAIFCHMKRNLGGRGGHDFACESEVVANIFLEMPNQ